VGADGTLVYGGEYLSCAARAPIAEGDIHLVSSPDSEAEWLFAERNKGVVGFLADGEILLPVAVLDKCAEVKARLFPKPRW
jgi:hypothetical protein